MIRSLQQNSGNANNTSFLNTLLNISQSWKTQNEVQIFILMCFFNKWKLSGAAVFAGFCFWDGALLCKRVIVPA